MAKTASKIENAEQFDKSFDAIATELRNANLYYNLYLDINSSFNEYKSEVNESPAFWGIVRSSILDKAFLGLCRVYDSHKDTNSLANLLRAFQSHPNFAELIRPLEQLDGHVDNSKTSYSPASMNFDQLTADIDFSSVENPAVHRLITWRSNIFIHKNFDIIAGKKVLSVDHPNYGDFELLLKNGMKIVNRYAHIFRASEYSLHFSQKNDFKYVLDCVREALRIREAKYRAELEHYGLNPDDFINKT